MSGPVKAAPQLAVSGRPDELFWRLVRERRSIRRYTDQPVSRELLSALLEAARWAPSAHNRQPWRFCVVVDGPLKLELAERMGERWQHDLAADGAPSDEVARRVSISRKRIGGAPALFVACVTMADMDHYADERRNSAEWTMAVQSTALACQNLLLAAHHFGLGACWLCAALFAPDILIDTLKLPAGWQPQALLTVGYPAEVKSKGRAPLETQIVWR